MFRVGTGGAAALLLRRAIGDGRSVGFTKRVKVTRFAALDTRVFAPLCAIPGLAGLAAVLS